MFHQEVLLSMNRGMWLHLCIAQVGFERGHDMSLLRYDDYELNVFYVWIMNMNMNYAYDFLMSFT